MRNKWTDTKWTEDKIGGGSIVFGKKKKIIQWTDQTGMPTLLL